MRIAIGGFLHESHSFAPIPTRWVDFLAPGGWPAVQRPATLLDTLRPSAVPAAGAIRLAESRGVTLAPLSWGFANPAGPVTAEAFERLAALIFHDLQAALEEGPLDGLYLDLHGAMVAEHFPDAEGELLRRARAILGPDLPITASLDPHCNLTEAMVRHADALAPFRTYPHVDMKEAGARAMQLLFDRIALGRPFAKAFRQIDYLIPITAQCTLVSPMRDAMAERGQIAERTGVAELALCFGFPYADFPDCGMALAAFAADPAAAEDAATALALDLSARETAFTAEIHDAAAGVAEALRLAAGATRPVVLADTQDNPGGGGHGDTTGLLAALMDQKAEGAVLALINDAESAAACHAAGEGAEVALSLGGKSDGAPLAVTARVLKLTDGCFTCTGPMAGGNPADLGPTALISPQPGIRVIVTSRKMQAYDQALFRHVGVEPSAQRLLALKSSVHFRADFQPIAAAVLVVAAPGPVVADPATLPFTSLRPGLRLRPGDNRRTV
ncbi:M81 family metallopeptidase [Falsiroseomonas selenitidurans]|uniref:Microcystinase C n=1 Tax=Falsiroseomonas selenitidurans TaxID=2716335 RepID=A0ABX1E3F3_9PROT|nr:M81 family metallopeptidase [Falsiroseomonas selenitidurans]NKC31536.1 M81 family metallopeptidase [Falsiroseomonas selenitidurans]